MKVFIYLNGKMGRGGGRALPLRTWNALQKLYLYDFVGSRMSIDEKPFAPPKACRGPRSNVALGKKPMQG